MKSKSESEQFSEMPFAPFNINNSDNASSVSGPVEKYSLNKEALNE